MDAGEIPMPATRDECRYQLCLAFLRSGPATHAILVIFGPSGDLANRKLVPTLYNSAAKHDLPKGFALIAVAKQPLGQDEFRKCVRASVREFGGAPDDCEFCRRIDGRLCYLSGRLAGT
jgi:glucose-6-phosphate 1-dehydrogenase